MYPKTRKSADLMREIKFLQATFQSSFSLGKQLSGISLPKTACLKTLRLLYFLPETCCV